MYLPQIILMCLLSYAAGDISEKLKLGQAIPGTAQSSEFTGLLAPFSDGQQNAKRPRISGIKGGRPSGIKGGLSGQQIGSGTLTPSRRAPIPFGNHGDDDDENNLDRICNDAFHSFLCQPVGPRRGRIDGKLRPGAKIPPGILSGLSSNVKPTVQLPNQSGGALLPTLLDDEEGKQYPEPTNSAPTIDNSGYFYPKPQKQPNIDNSGYFYPKPQEQPNLLGNPSQVSGTVLKPSNEYLPPVTTTTPNPPTSTPNYYNPISNIVPAQSNAQPFVVNPQNNGYTYEKPQYNYDKPAIQLNVPPFQFKTTTLRPALLEQNTISTAKPFLNQYAPTNQVVYEYPKPINSVPIYNQPLVIPQIVTNTLPPATYYSQSSNTGSIFNSPSILSTPIVAASNVIGTSDRNNYFYPVNDNFKSLLPAQTTGPTLDYLPPVGFPVPQETKLNVFPSPIFPPSTVPPFLDSSPTTTYRVPQFQFSSPRPFSFSTSTFPPVTFIPTTERPRITTVSPTTYRTTAAPLVSVTTLRPFVYLNQQSTSTPYSFPTTTPKPVVFNFASSNDVQYSSPLKPSNGYLPPPGQPIPSSANVAPFYQPVPPPQPTTTTPKPTLPPKPSNEYLPQIDVRFEGSSSNVQPNIEGGSLLAAEDDGPSSNFLPSGRTTERTHTLEELCRDAFHSFLCKPIDKPRRRIDGRIRAGAQIPSNVLIGSKVQQRFPSGGQYQSTNLNPRIVQSPNGNDIFAVSASDSTNLAKHFAQQSRNSVANNLKYPTPNKNVTTSIPVTPSTTPRPSRYTTTNALRVHLEASASAASLSQLSLKDSNLKKDKITSASTRNDGYNYSKPPKPFTYPTTISGYNYQKPKKPLTLPTTVRPSTARTTTSRPIFGRRLSSGQRQYQNSLGQQQQQELLDDPFDTNEIVNPDNGLPPASQFEIIKP